MPLFEYFCQICNNKFEKVLKQLDNGYKTANCPKCNNKAEKIFSMPNIIVN